MEYFQDSSGIPAAANYTPLQSSDEQQTNNNITTATHWLSRLPQRVEHGRYSTAPSHGLSPPQEYLGQEGAFDGHAIPTRAEYNHPPTPPHGHTIRHQHARAFSTPQLSLPGSSAQAYQNNGNGPTSMRQAQSNNVGYYQNQQPLSYGHSFQSAQGFRGQPRRESAPHNLQTSGMDRWRPFQCTNVQPETPSPSYDWRSSYMPASSDRLSIIQPTVQQWPTHALGQQASSVTPHHQRKRTLSSAAAIDPSPGHDGITPPDDETLRRQQRFQQSAEKHRQRRQSKANSIALSQDHTRAKRKRSSQNLQDFASTAAPHLRKPKVPEPEIPYSSDFDLFYDDGTFFPADHGPALTSYGQTPLSQDAQGSSETYISPHAPRFNTSIFNVPSKQPLTHPLESVPAPPAPPIDWDTQPQEITDQYEDYKYSVTLYELNTQCGFDFAQSWLENLFEDNNLKPPTYKWYAHSTRGFIKGGDRLSFIALHNAANPFEWGLPPTSTTSIGVYGRYWHEHDEVHWKTFAPGIRWLLDWCQENGGISVKQTWKFDNPRAAERRFHRAYWLASRMESIKDLLKHGELVDEVHDAVLEEVDDGFEVTEEDLQNGHDHWDNTAEESEQAWNRVLENNEAIGDALDGTIGFQHVATGSSEMQYLG